MAGLTCIAAELCGPCRTELQSSAFFGLGHCSLILLDDISQDTNFLKGDFPDWERDCGNVCLAHFWYLCCGLKNPRDVGSYPGCWNSWAQEEPGKAPGRSI